MRRRAFWGGGLSTAKLGSGTFATHQTLSHNSSTTAIKLERVAKDEEGFGFQEISRRTIEQRIFTHHCEIFEVLKGERT
jgi:hypothetical protein